MSADFSRSLRALNHDGFGRSIAGILVAALLLAAWLTWFFTVTVGRYEVSERARIETDQSAYAIQAPVAGRVVLSNLTLGRDVETGDTLVEIEPDAQQLLAKEEESRVAAIGPQLDALRTQLTALEAAARTEKESNVAALAQSRAQYQEADAQRVFAEKEERRLERLSTAGLVPNRDFERALADARSRRAAAEALQQSTERLALEQRRSERERDAVISRLLGDIKAIEGTRLTALATIERMRFEIARRRIAAPVAGRLGEVAVLRVGGWVDEGAMLGAIVPRGKLRIVAEFPPPAALGRITPGQSALLRLEGFPWTQYGAIRATVERVGNEVRDGLVRVELLIDGETGAGVPMQHGLPGVVEVQTETLTPAMLVFRTAGQLLARREQQYR